ncbi:MAG: M57 family metalloprotease [Saprospiraceae bacterium]
MQKLINTLFLLALVSLSFSACTNEETAVVDEQKQISAEVLLQIKKLGFSTENVIKEADHYIVEGDIVLHEEDLERTDLHENFLRIADVEQYRTTNLVKSLPRVITVSVDAKLGSKYVTTTDAAIARYNAEGLQITMRRVASGGDIKITAAPLNASYLASAGFPSSTGNPYGSVKINNAYLDANGWGNNSITSIIAHEIGHCIGFRHTDYMDRSFSCGGGYANEGQSNVGAIHIPGTPTDADRNSWMLACIGKNDDRPFNANDKTALKYLY